MQLGYTPRRLGRFLPTARTLALALGLAPPASPQNLSNASIDGTVTDDSGAALPGVVVTVTSPSLQVPQLTQVIFRLLIG